ncbi:Nn.00g057620.m01.CDS01 [Neocucurbitaria sp. VM-36]
MADQVTAPVHADAAKVVEEPTRSTEAIAEPAVAEAKPAEGGIVATSGVAEVPESDAPQEDVVAKDEDTVNAQADTTAVNDDAGETNPGDSVALGYATNAADAPATNGTPAGKKAVNGRRKSGASVSEQNKKKTPAKGKKKAPELRLNVSAGDMFMVAMRGYQPWPVIVCDEEMLPESLLSKRPVSAKRIDGTYRDDFLEGGKNAKDRRYPIMFLGTNEFAWQVNTELLTFDIDEVKKDVEAKNQAKKNKALWEAYQIAAEGHDLSHFKQMLLAHEQALQEDAEQREQKELQKKEKAEKAAKRKSTAADSPEDVEMEDAGDGAAPSAKKANSSKKRKKTDESDGDNDKPAKTPKTKLKLTTKTPKDSSAAKPKKEAKSKKNSSEEAEPIAPEEPPMTEEERLRKREKQILYLRHRLQKGFLSRDQAPKDEDMEDMSEYVKQLEQHHDLEAEVIKKTKVHKVLKAIIKLDSIPKEDEYNFKKRSNDLLSKWGGALAAENEPAISTTATEPSTNGVKREDEVKKPESPKDDTPAEKAEVGETKDETSTDSTITKTADKDGDISMSEADKEVVKDVPAGTTDAGSNAAEAGAGTETATATNDPATA